MKKTILSIFFSLIAGFAARGDAGWNSLDDLAEGRIAVFSGTVHDAFVARKYPAAKLLRFDSTADMILSIKKDKVDVTLVDTISAAVIMKTNPELGVLQEDVLNMPVGVGFGKRAPELRKRFNRFLKEIRADGTYDAMFRRWCGGDPEAAVMPEIPESGGEEKYVLGVAVADLPYVAVMDGKYVGFDVEMIKRFAEREKFRMEIVSLEFPSLVTALASGKVDMITDGIAISEERSRMVDFSEPYMEFRTVALALKSKIAKFAGPAAAAPAEKSFVRKVADSFRSNIIVERRWLLILDGLRVTVVISIFSAILGTLLGALVCFMRLSKKKAASLPAGLFISILRGTPVLVLLMLVYYVVFASVNVNPVFVAIIAFGLNFAAYAAEIFRTGIEGVDKGQTEAGIAMGFTKTGTFIHIILPQMVRRILPVYKGEFISLVKNTSIVGYIAVQDLTKASDIIRSRTFDAFFPLVMVALLYFSISWLLLQSLEYLERVTDPKFKRKKAGSL